MIDGESGAVPVKQPREVDIQQEKNHLRTVKSQHHHGFRVQPDQDICQKVQHEQTHQLASADTVSSRLIPHRKETEIVIGIHSDQKDHQVSGYLYDQISQELSPTPLRA